MEKAKKIVKECINTIKEHIPETYQKKIVAAFSKTYDFDELKQEAWEDISDVYHKYPSDREWQNAVRETMFEVSEEIGSDNWISVYRKLKRRRKVRSFI